MLDRPTLIKRIDQGEAITYLYFYDMLCTRQSRRPALSSGIQRRSPSTASYTQHARRHSRLLAEIQESRHKRGRVAFFRDSAEAAIGLVGWLGSRRCGNTLRIK